MDQHTNGHAQPRSDSISFAIARASEGGYVITVGTEFAAARSTMGEVVQWMGGKLGSSFNESPYMPQQHQPVMQQPRPSSVPPVVPTYQPPSPPPQQQVVESYPPIPSGIMPGGDPEDDQSVNGLARKIGSLADRLPRVASHAFVAVLGLYSIWPFGA